MLRHALKFSKNASFFTARRFQSSNPAYTLEITQNARDMLKEKLIPDANPPEYLRIGIDSGGCVGFKSVLAIAT